MLGYVLNTHNPLRVAEDMVMMDHMLQGCINVAFVHGYQTRWVQNDASQPGVEAVEPWNKKQAADLKSRRAFEEAVAVIIERAWKIGTDEMFFLLGAGLLPRDVILRSFELFATKVRPRFAAA